jgi:hypothetical protein
VNRVKNLILKWKDGAKPKRPAAYTKHSRTTKLRKMKQQAERAASAANCHLITHFLSQSIEITISADESADYRAIHPVMRTRTILTSLIFRSKKIWN